MTAMRARLVTKLTTGHRAERRAVAAGCGTVHAPMRRWTLAGALCALLLVVAHASAAESILPLDEVRPGMRCTGLTVVRGIDIASFDVEIVDIVAGDPVAEQPLLLVRVSGPNADETGIAQGFSGSPVVCDGRIAGAIAYGTGDYGNELGYATPIEAMLGEPFHAPPRRVRRRPRGVPAAVPLAAPLTVTGLAPRVFAPYGRALRAAGLPVALAPAAPVGARFPAQPLQPGSSMAVGLATGDVALSAVGTVSYVDGDRVWAFGHALDGAGRRSLLLQDSFVYTVVDNPLGVEGAVSYKLAAPGHTLGTITSDGRHGVAGVAGAAPPTIPLRIVTRNASTGERRVTRAELADEADVGLPGGYSPASIVAPMAVAQAAYAALDGSPAHQSARMCVRIAIRELDAPARFCNRYVGAFGALGSAGSGPYVFDLFEALTAIDDFQYGTPHVERIDVRLEVRPGLEQAFLRWVRGPKVLRRGGAVTLRVGLQRYRGERFTRRVRLRVPEDAPLGRRSVRLIGTPADGAAGEQEIVIVLGGDGAQTDGGATGPRSFAELAQRIAAIHRRDQVAVALPPATRRGKRRGSRPRPLFRDRELRISGSAAYEARVVRASR